MLGLIVLPLFSQHCGSCAAGKKASLAPASVTKEVTVLGAPKKAHWISKDHYVVYEWSKKPKIGTFILSVKVFDKAKKQITNMDITADAYMPSMKGSHDTGDKALKLNKKNDYAIPVYFMMLGDWEILLKFNLEGKHIASAAIRLDI